MTPWSFTTRSPRTRTACQANSDTGHGAGIYHAGINLLSLQFDHGDAIRRGQIPAYANDPAVSNQNGPLFDDGACNRVNGPPAQQECIAGRQGLGATVEAETDHVFAKHTHEQFGIGILWRGAQNLMAGGDGPYGLSADGEAFGAGVLEHLSGLLALGAPSVASYLRLVPQHWAGAYACWGLENREAALRMVALGYRFGYHRELPTLAWTNVTGLVDSVAPGRLAALVVEYADVPVVDLVTGNRRAQPGPPRVSERLALGGVA